MQFTVPNLLTYFRILAIPTFVIVFYLPMEWARPASGILFGVAALTDWLDGYLARRLNQTSSFGAFLDPVADKLIVSTALVLLVQSDPAIPMTLVAIVIIGREITISALREWMSSMGELAQVSVTDFAKWKTTLQMFGIFFMLYEYPQFGWPIYGIGMALLLVAVVLTLWSMADYLRAAWPVMRDRA